MKNSLWNYLLLIIFIFSIFLWLYRFYPYFISDIPLWYDPWLYRWMFLEYYNNLPKIDFSGLNLFTKQAFPPFLWFLWNILFIIGFNVDWLIWFWLAFFSVITSIYIYLYLKKYWFYTAIFWMIIFFTSIIQYKVFYLNYYKQILWIIFILSSIYLLERKKYLLSIPIIVSLFALHRPSGLFFLLLFLIYKIFNLIKTFRWTKLDIYAVIFSWLMALVLYIPLLDYLILPLLSPLFSLYSISWSSWTFFSLYEFFSINNVIILFSFYWLYLKIRKKNLDFTFSWYLLWFIWVLFGLFFYSRMLIFFDIFIIITAAYWFWVLFKQNKKFFIVFILFFSLQSYNYTSYVYRYNKPYIWNKEFKKVKELDDLLPSNSMLMTSHKNYSPRLYWYTKFDIIAPWLFEYDLWTKDEWKKWWSVDWKVKCEMLKDYNIYKKQVYFWLWDDQKPENLDNGKCFDLIYKNANNKIFKVKYEK